MVLYESEIFTRGQMEHCNCVHEKGRIVMQDGGMHAMWCFCGVSVVIHVALGFDVSMPLRFYKDIPEALPTPYHSTYNGWVRFTCGEEGLL